MNACGLFHATRVYVILFDFDGFTWNSILILFETRKGSNVVILGIGLILGRLKYCLVEYF